MTIEKNRLWVAPTTALALQLCETHPHSYACDDHCLFIGPERPEWAVEVDEELGAYLTERDMMWIGQESERILREQTERYRDELAREQEAFFERFEANIRALTEGQPREQKEQQNAGDGDSAGGGDLP